MDGQIANLAQPGSDSPLVSVSCLTFNHRKYIGSALDGILMQKVNFAIEILIHDDASTDGTADMVREYAARNPGLIRPVYQSENQWSQGINPGILNRNRARGKYLALCDGDDYWIDPNKLQRQVDYLEANPNCGLVFTETKRYTVASGRMQTNHLRRLDLSPKTFADFLANKWFICPSTWVIRRDILAAYNAEGLPKPGWIAGDFSLLLWIRKRFDVHCFPEPMTVYRILPNSVSHCQDSESVLRFSDSVLDIVRYYANDAPALFQEFESRHIWNCFFWICLSADRDKATSAYNCLRRDQLLGIRERFIYALSYWQLGKTLCKGSRVVWTYLREYRLLGARA